MSILKQVEEIKVVPVVVINDLNEIDIIINSLIQGNVKIGEVCYRTDLTSEAIRIISQKYPDFLLGAGTIINTMQCEDAITNGAKFIVSPGFSEAVFEVCNKHNIPYIPGVTTPTEIMNALAHGLTYLKFFPAGVYGGLKAIKALSSAFPQVRFMPTGGVDNKNLAEFVKEKSIFAIGGSWLLKDNIVDNCLKANEIIKGAK